MAAQPGVFLVAHAVQRAQHLGRGIAPDQLDAGLRGRALPPDLGQGRPEQGLVELDLEDMSAQAPLECCKIRQRQVLQGIAFPMAEAHLAQCMPVAIQHAGRRVADGCMRDFVFASCHGGYSFMPRVGRQWPRRSAA